VELLELSSERSRRGLVEAAHAIRDITLGHQRKALRGKPQHLEVGDPELPSQLARPRSKAHRRGRVARGKRQLSLEGGEPAVLGGRAEVV
jgi:hypothetical protein